MATQVTLLTDLPSGLIRSSEIPTIAASVTGTASVDVWLAPHDEDQDNAIYSSTFYALDSRISIYDLAELVEDDMRGRDVVVFSYDLHIGPLCSQINVLYCDYVADGFDPDNSFLTTLPTQRVYAGSKVFVTLVGDASQTTISGLMVHDEDVARYERFEAECDDETIPGEALAVPFDDWADRYTSYGPDDDVRLISAVISNGNRSKTVYFLPGKPDIRLVFKNCFNALESVELKGLLTDKTTVNQEIALVGGRRVAYDRRTEKVYEFVSEGLLDAEARSIDQLLNSHSAWVMVNGKAEPVIITDHSCEISNDDETIPSVKFSWAFADRRPHINPDALAASLRKPGIFSPQFSSQFC